MRRSSFFTALFLSAALFFSNLALATGPDTETIRIVASKAFEGDKGDHEGVKAYAADGSVRLIITERYQTWTLPTIFSATIIYSSGERRANPLFQAEYATLKQDLARASAACPLEVDFDSFSGIVVKAQFACR